MIDDPGQLKQVHQVKGEWLDKLQDAPDTLLAAAVSISEVAKLLVTALSPAQNRTSGTRDNIESNLGERNKDSAGWGVYLNICRSICYQNPSLLTAPAGTRGRE